MGAIHNNEAIFNIFGRDNLYPYRTWNSWKKCVNNLQNMSHPSITYITRARYNTFLLIWLEMVAGSANGMTSLIYFTSCNWGYKYTLIIISVIFHNNLGTHLRMEQAKNVELLIPYSIWKHLSQFVYMSPNQVFARCKLLLGIIQYELLHFKQF